MSRIRTIKPEFFRHSGLYFAEKETGLPLRIAFAGLWTAVDREGRFKWQPPQLKLDCLPYDDLEFSEVLNALWQYNFIQKYIRESTEFGYIPSWKDHQVVNTREAQSRFPDPFDENSKTIMHVHAPIIDGVSRSVNVPKHLRQEIFERDGYKCLRCKTTDNLTIDHIFPQSLGGNHSPLNLRTLCLSCNCGRPVAGNKLLEDLKIDGLTLDDMPRICMHVHAYADTWGREGKGREEEAYRKGSKEEEVILSRGEG